MKKDKKIGRWEYIIITVLVGLVINGMIMIGNTLDNVYNLYLVDYHFSVYWIVLNISGFINGFLFISIWSIIKRYFGDKIK